MVLLAAPLAVVLFPLDSPLMTASNPKPRFPMGPNLSKALIATGLAAALVGCGGGSSDDTAMGDGSSQPSQPSQEEVQQRAISAAKATFGRAQSTLQTALASATTDQQRIAAYEVMKSASDAFRDALYQNDGSAADLLIATNAYDRATSEISKLEMMIADAEKMADQQRREMAINNAKGVYDEEKEALDLVLNGPNPTEEKIFNASTQFKNAANTYLSILIANEGPQDDKVQAEKVLVQQDIDENNDERIFPFVNGVLNVLQDRLEIIDGNKAPTTEQVESVEMAMNELLRVINAASLTGAARSPYTLAIRNARNSMNTATATILENIDEAGRYFDAINSNPFNNTASYSDDSTTTPTMDKEINVTIGATTNTLMPSGTTLSPAQEWDGEEFTGDNIKSHVWSNSRPYIDPDDDETDPTDDHLSYYPAGDRGRQASVSHDNELSDDLVESIYNRRLIKIDANLFNEYSMLRLPNNKDTNNDGSLDEAVVKGYFNGIEGTFICSGTKTSNHVCGAQMLTDGQIILGEIHASFNDAVDTDNGTGQGNGVWTFLPDKLDDMVASYASFGYWIQTNPAGEPVRIGSFHDFTGREKYELDSGSTRVGAIVSGTADYTGGAAGLYAFYDETEEGSYHGQFTANVSLTADFAEDQISGTIKNFTATNSTGVVAPNSDTWQVDLEPTSFDDSGQIGSSTTTGDVTWTIGQQEHMHQGSRWSGNFREFVEDTSLTDASNAAPNTVTGQFSAYASDPSGDDFARLIGAFGAEEN